jgi:hypothetical protein
MFPRLSLSRFRYLQRHITDRFAFQEPVRHMERLCASLEASSNVYELSNDAFVSLHVQLRFTELAHALTSPTDAERIVSAWWPRLVESHALPHGKRAYHTLQHLHEIFCVLDAFAEQEQANQLVQRASARNAQLEAESCSVWGATLFHDAVYAADAPKGDSERASAQLFRDFIQSINETVISNNSNARMSLDADRLCRGRMGDVRP